MSREESALRTRVFEFCTGPETARELVEQRPDSGEDGSQKDQERDGSLSSEAHVQLPRILQTTPRTARRLRPYFTTAVTASGSDHSTLLFQRGGIWRLPRSSQADQKEAECPVKSLSYEPTSTAL